MKSSIQCLLLRGQRGELAAVNGKDCCLFGGEGKGRGVPLSASMRVRYKKRDGLLRLCFLLSCVLSTLEISGWERGE